MFHQMLDRAEAGDQVGALIRGIKRDDVRRGQILAKPGTISMHNHFAAQVVPIAILCIFSSYLFIQYTVSQKNCTHTAGRHKLCYFSNTKKIRNICFVGNFILNKSCEIYCNDVTMTSFIGNM